MSTTKPEAGRRHQLEDNVYFEQTDRHVRLRLPGDYTVLSSAVLNGGFTRANNIINLKVARGRNDTAGDETPEACLAAYARHIGISEKSVGMMTAASMASLAVAMERVGDTLVAVLVTSGLSNPRRAGDEADYPYLANEPPAPGTINTIIYSSRSLTAAAMVEAVVIATEAKAAVLQDFAVLSPVSKTIATGTGTDSVAMVCAPGPFPLRYAGKHVRFGEVLARLIIQALSTSVSWEFSDQGKL